MKGPAPLLVSLVIVLAGLVGLRCNHCDPSEAHCENGELYTCVPSGNGSEVVNTTARSFQPTQFCGGEPLCVEPMESRAECVVSPSIDPACPADVRETVVCAGTTYVECWFGYRTKFVACATCDVSSSNHPCGGVLGDACVSDSDCASPLTCHAFPDADGGIRRACSQTCLGSTDACTIGEGLSVGHDAPVPATFPAVDPTRLACLDGWCSLN